jgi:hypothetical protein
MYEALANAAEAVAPGGRLFVAIYNDQGWRSRAWRIVKRTYGRVPTALRVPYARLVMMPSELLRALNAARRGRLPSYVRDRRRFKPGRGMSRRHDLIDWVGGYPFEVARPEQVIEFACARGFKLLWLKTVRSIGNNQFVFERPAG